MLPALQLEMIVMLCSLHNNDIIGLLPDIYYDASCLELIRNGHVLSVSYCII